MLDISGALLVLLVALALALLFAVRSKTKKNGWSSRMRRFLKQAKAASDSAVFSEGHLESLSKSFAGENGLLVRTCPWGEFQTASMMTREGPIWFPIGNVSHISTHTEDDGVGDDGKDKKKTFGVIHMKNGCMYITDDTFDSDRQFVAGTRITAFQNVSRTNEKAVER